MAAIVLAVTLLTSFAAWLARGGRRAGREVSPVRFAAALVLPFVILAIQAALWPVLSPFAFFGPLAGVFLSSILGGARAGLAGTFNSALLVFFFFIPPVHTLAKDALSGVLPVTLFLILGVSLSVLHERVVRARYAEKAADEAMRASDARFSGILSTAFDAIISIDEGQRIILYNDAAARIFGYGQEEMLGRPLTLLMPERFRESHERYVRHFAQAADTARLTGTRSAEIFGLRRSGEEFPAEASISKHAVGRRWVFTVIVRDITQRRQLERELAETLDEQRFLASVGEVFSSSLDASKTVHLIAAAAVESIADFLIVDLVEEEGRLRRVKVAHANPETARAAQALESFSPREAQPLPVLAAIRTQQTQKWDSVSEETLRVHFPAEVSRSIVADLKPQSMMFVPMVWQGKSLGVMTFVSSRPDRRYVLADQRVAEEVARRAALALDNARLYKTSCDATQARDEILEIVAHDLRNPLHAIQLLASVVLRQLSPDSRLLVEGSVETIMRSAERANRLIQDLLEMRRHQMGRLALRRECVSATHVVRDLAAAQRPILTSAGLLLRVEVPASLPTMWADKDRVLQVFENLLVNAIKFTPGGGTITIAACPSGGAIQFSVADTGPGIFADLSKLFERFWQASNGDRRGMGLGLTIAKQVVEAHGGRIWVESQVGRGTTFFFTIPVCAALPAEHEHPVTRA